MFLPLQFHPTNQMYSHNTFHFDPNDDKIEKTNKLAGSGGFIYFLGTKGYTCTYASPYIDKPIQETKNVDSSEQGNSNPRTTSVNEQWEVLVKFSGQDYGSEGRLLLKTPQDIYLGVTGDRLMEIIFPVKFKPNYYSIWNTSDSHRAQFALLNWQLLGWDEKRRDWVVIRHHKNDRTIAVTSFARGNFALECDRYYDRFRVLCTGNNQWGNHAGLMISTIEFYGHLFQKIQGSLIWDMKDKNVCFHFESH
jgi:hypothetical protein